MTVRELIKALKREDPEALVLVEKPGVSWGSEEVELGASSVARGTWRPNSALQKFVLEGQRATKCKIQFPAVILSNSCLYQPLPDDEDD